MKFILTTLLISLSSLTSAENGTGALIKLHATFEQTDDSRPQPTSDRAKLDLTTRKVAWKLKKLGFDDCFVQSTLEDTIWVTIHDVANQDPTQIKFENWEWKALSFHAVHPENSSLAEAVADGTQEAPKGFLLLKETDDSPILVEQTPKVDGYEIADIFPDYSRPGVMNVILTDKGGKQMMDYSSTIQPGRDRMAHILDGKVLSAPGFQSKKLGQQFIITGCTKNQSELEQLILLMLPFPAAALEVEEIRLISPKNLVNKD